MYGSLYNPEFGQQISNVHTIVTTMSHIFSTVSSHFSLAPEMQNETSRVCRSFDCKRCRSIIWLGELWETCWVYHSYLAKPKFLAGRLRKLSWPYFYKLRCKVRPSGVPSTAGLWREVWVMTRFYNAWKWRVMCRLDITGLEHQKCLKRI